MAESESFTPQDSVRASSTFEGTVIVEAPSECGPCQAKNNMKVAANLFCSECDDFLCEDCKSWHQAIRGTSTHNVIQAKDVIRHYCGSCNVKSGTKVRASTYCLDCDDYLCEECEGWHSVFKGTKSHHVKVCATSASSGSTMGAVKSFKDRKAVLTRKLVMELLPNEMKPRISGASFLPDGSVVFIDYKRKYLIFYDASLKLVFSKQFDSPPFDIDAYDENEVAISFPLENKVRRFSLRGGINGKGSLTTRFTCYGVSYVNKDKIALIGTQPNTFCTMQVYGTEVTSAALGEEGKEVFRWPEYVTVDKQKMLAFVSDYDKNCVSALDISANNRVLFTYRNKDLSGPRGITSDKEGNIYVCGYTSHNVHQLDPDGRLINIVLSIEDGLKYPQTIAFKSGENFNEFVLTNFETSEIMFFKMV